MSIKHALQLLKALIRTPWSIRSVVLRDETKWFTNNTHRQSRAFTKLEHDLLVSGERPLRFAFSLMVLHGLFITLVVLSPLNLLPSTWISLETSQQLANFSTIWTIQATLAALVYPIVISFVAVYLQRRPAADAFIHLYMLDSGALVAGISSLTLLVAMGTQFLVMSAWGNSYVSSLVVIDTFCFVLNAAMTTFFLFRTVEFLRPDLQARIIQRYTINVALPRDLHRFNSDYVLDSAINHGWFSVPSFLDDSAPKGPRLLIGRDSFFKDGVVQENLHLKVPSRLVDVRIWFMKLAIESWYRKALKISDSLDGEQDQPLLKLPMTFGSIYEKDFPLAIVTNGPDLSAYERFLLRRAVAIRPASHDRYGIQVEAILNELAAEVRNMAAQSDNQGFDHAYSILIDLHELLLAACQDNKESSDRNSWALVRNTESFWGRPLHEDWSEIYRAVFQSAIESMVRDTRPLRRLCHLLTHFDQDELSSSPIEIHEHLLKLPPLMMHLLNKWWTFRAEEQGITKPSHKQMTLLRPPLNIIYEEVLNDFVGGWENARPGATWEIRDRDLPDWDTRPELARLSAKHIEETARMLLTAVFGGDQAASEWLADVLSKWWSALNSYNEPYQLYEKSSFITLDDLELPWEKFSSKYGLALERPEVQPSLQEAAFQAALQNYWTDIRLITIELMLDWVKEVSIDLASNSLAFEIATGLLTGKHWKAGGQTINPLKGISATKYLVAKLRQLSASEDSGSSYLGRLDNFVSRIKSLQRPNMVSSRVYMLGGADNVESLRASQLALMAVFTKSAWESSRTLDRQLIIWQANQPSKLNILKGVIGNWCDKLPNTLELSIKHIDLIKRHLDPEASISAENALLYVKNGLVGLHQEIVNLLNEAIAAEQIDPARLLEIELNASAYGFGKEKGHFPVNQFTIEYTRSPLEDFPLPLMQLQRSEITRRQIDRRVVNDKKYYADTMAQLVASVILDDVLQKSEIREVKAADADTYWKVLQAEADLILARGEIPILILGNSSRPEWIREWEYHDLNPLHKIPNDLQLRHVEGRGTGYQFDINQIHVYSASLPTGKSLILSEEEFHRVTFTEYSDGRYVRAEVIESQYTNKNLIDLKLTFSRRVEVARTKITCLVHSVN
jgi:hypothetical protein